MSKVFQPAEAATEEDSAWSADGEKVVPLYIATRTPDPAKGT